MPNPEFDIEQARYNMVEQQIRPWEVLDQDVLDLLFTVRREDFVPPEHRALAFADLEIPLPNGYRMWTPKMEARVLQDLQLRRHERVLEIGTGSGYFTALLARVVAEVHSVEIDPATAEAAQRRLADYGNVKVIAGDGARGFGDEAWDAIVLTGSTPVLAERFFEQLRPGGRVFAVVGEKPAMKARLTHWNGPTARVPRDLFETVILPLRNAPQPARFVF
jgi:protein-L-isoaspartate(D-aspartate) O-methyltransferase